MFFVYLLQNQINLKVYIGKSNNTKIRFSSHINIAKTGFSKGKKTFNLIHKALRKYGKENFSFQILEEYEFEQECLEAEKFWIEFFRSDVNKFGNECGYNLTAGGEGVSGRKRSDEEKRKISLSLTGRLISEETKNKMSITSLSRPRELVFNVGNKADWPDDLALLEQVKINGFTAVGKKLGVSNVAVRERLKRRKLI